MKYQYCHFIFFKKNTLTIFSFTVRIVLTVSVNIFSARLLVSDLAEPGTFAGNDAIVAFARSQQVKVVIHQLNAPLWEVLYSCLTLI